MDVLGSTSYNSTHQLDIRFGSLLKTKCGVIFYLGIGRFTRVDRLGASKPDPGTLAAADERVTRLVDRLFASITAVCIEVWASSDRDGRLTFVTGWRALFSSPKTKNTGGIGIVKFDG